MMARTGGTVTAGKSLSRWLRMRGALMGLLRQGLSPEKVAFTVALGILLGVTPVLGSTMVLCTVAALAFGLNLAAIQLVNWMVFPLQLILLVPWFRTGAWMFGYPPSRISASGIVALTRLDFIHAVAALWVATMHALVAWFICGGMAVGLMYVLLVPVMRRMRSEEARNPNQTQGGQEAVLQSEGDEGC